MAESTDAQAAREMAASAAHALNNGLAMLEAASDYLADLPPSPAEAKARRALAGAQRRLQVVSEALGLFGLSEADLAATTGSPSFRQSWDAPYATRLGRALEQAADVLWIPTEGAWTPMTFPMDGETLKSVLVCMAVVLRRAAGPAAAMSCQLQRAPAASVSQAQWVFAMRAEGHRWGDGGDGGEGHPCALALARARPVLAALGVDMVRREEGDWALRGIDGGSR